MGTATFQDLYDGFCDLVGTARHALEMDVQGVMAFSTELSGVLVNVMHTRDTHPENAFVLVDFGPPPEQDQAIVLRLLLQTNFAMLGEANATTFSIHPVFGNVTLQASYPFTERTASDLLLALRALTTMAVQWRGSYFLDVTPQQAAQPVSGPFPGAFA